MAAKKHPSLIGDHSWRRWKVSLLILLAMAATAAAPPAPESSSECGCSLLRAERHVLCRRIGQGLCFKDAGAKIEVEKGLTVRRLTLRDAGYSGTLALNNTELKGRSINDVRPKGREG